LFSACDCFPNNLTLCRIHPLNLLSPNFPEYCDNLNCSAQISLENPLNTNDYVESLQIQFNSFRTELDMDLLHLLQILLGMKRESLYRKFYENSGVHQGWVGTLGGVRTLY